MTTAGFHNRVLAVLEELGNVLDSINDLDRDSRKELDSNAVLKLIEAQGALREGARLIDAPMMRRAIERAKVATA